MPEACIIILVLSGIALTVNIAVCLYTLYLAQQSQRRQYTKGFIDAFIHRETSSGISHKTLTPQNPNTQN